MVTDLCEPCQPEETNIFSEVLKSVECGTPPGMLISSKHFITSGNIPDRKRQREKKFGEVRACSTVEVHLTGMGEALGSNPQHSKTTKQT